MTTIALNDIAVDHLIGARNRMTDRIDERIDRMSSEEIVSTFKALAHDDVRKDFNAQKVGLTDLLRNAEKYGSVEREDFDAAMARYFERIGSNVEESNRELSAYRDKSNEIMNARESARDERGDYL